MHVLSASILIATDVSSWRMNSRTHLQTKKRGYDVPYLPCFVGGAGVGSSTRRLALLLCCPSLKNHKIEIGNWTVSLSDQLFKSA